MKYEIKEEIIRNAGECRKGHSCLVEGRETLCRVEFGMDRKVPFIKCLYDNLCPYQRTFGNVSYCTCPVRQEIFNKYRE